MKLILTVVLIVGLIAGNAAFAVVLGPPLPSIREMASIREMDSGIPEDVNCSHLETSIAKYTELNQLYRSLMEVSLNRVKDALASLQNAEGKPATNNTGSTMATEQANSVIDEIILLDLRGSHEAKQANSAIYEAIEDDIYETINKMEEINITLDNLGDAIKKAVSSCVSSGNN